MARVGTAGARALFAAGVLAAGAALAGCGSDSGPPELTWYINPDNGTQAALAKKCTEQADGRYRIRTALLPSESTGQRQQLVRRLAAGDSGIDLISLDIPYLAEFANAGFIRQFTAAERTELTRGMLDGPIEGALWEDELFGVPFNTNTQLLWVHKSVAEEAGLDLSRQLTWDQVIEAAEQTGTTVQVQAARYEGYTVLINSLIASAGGQILRNPEAGRDVTPAIDSPAGKEAARIIGKLARSPAAAAGIANSDEPSSSEGFLAEDGGFQINWPFVYTEATTALAAAEESGNQEQIEAARAALDDFGWSRWPTVEEGTTSRPPLGGINLAVGAFGEHPKLAVDAVACITSAESQKTYMLGEGLLPTRESVYDDPEVQQAFPMANLLRTSVDESAPRPVTPYYPDITEAIQRTWHPPRSVGPGTPERSAELIVAALHDEELL